MPALNRLFTDDYFRECPAIEVDTSLGGVRVVRVLVSMVDENVPPLAAKMSHFADIFL